MLAQGTGDGGGAAVAAVGIVAGIALAVLSIAALWKVFTKAGEAGWKAIIPFLNLYVMLRIVGRPGWWLILLLVPFVNIVVAVVVYYDLARSFGHGVGFTLGLLILNIIFLPILGFGGSRYRGPAARLGI